MERNQEYPTTLQGAIVYFAEYENCHNFMVKARWSDGVTCPYCSGTEHSYIKKPRVWHCKACKKRFSLKVGTIFEDSPLGLQKWLPAMWLIASAKNGISSYEIHRALGVTQKTAWFMLQRIRLAMTNGTIMKMKGTVESDETYVGGKAKNMHYKKRIERIAGRGSVGKDIVHGLLERGNKKAKKLSRVKVKHVADITRETLHKEVLDNVEPYAMVCTDELPSYEGLSPKYIHAAINHAERYVWYAVHTNGMENFWSLLKRTIKGTYVSVNAEHLFRYLDEQAFRFNERGDDDLGRFLKVAGSVAGRRLTYKALICKDMSD